MMHIELAKWKMSKSATADSNATIASNANPCSMSTRTVRVMFLLLRCVEGIRPLNCCFGKFRIPTFHPLPGLKNLTKCSRTPSASWHCHLKASLSEKHGSQDTIEP